jgi:hypothetical protein
MKRRYIVHRFNRSSLAIIDVANEIIAEYQREGLTLTVRQLYYQFVSRDKMANKQSEYGRLVSIISTARLAGLVDWDAIEDRTRSLRGLPSWKDPGEIIRSSASSFRLDHWRGQPYMVEVWVEKEALVGVIGEVCKELDVNFFACKGYTSQSEMWAASERFKMYSDRGQEPIILHLGDHDPSGIDMTRDIEDRQDMFAGADTIRRLALNMDQVRKFQPPPNPAKSTDARFQEYARRYGHKSWELDALEPRVLRDLIKENVLHYRNEKTYKEVLREEQEGREVLQKFEKNWDKEQSVPDCAMCPEKIDNEIENGEEHY